jgi:hypothetical protein
MERSEPDASTKDPIVLPRRSARDVLNDAVDLYLVAPSHDRSEITAFAALVGGLLDVADAGRRRDVARLLSRRPDTPPEIARRLALDAIEIAEPMILHSPVLTSSDLIAIMRRSPDHVHCVGRRLDLAPDVAAVLVDATVVPPAPAPVVEARRRRTDLDATMPTAAPQIEAPRRILAPRPAEPAAETAQRTVQPARVTRELPPPLFDVAPRPAAPKPAERTIPPVPAVPTLPAAAKAPTAPMPTPTQMPPLAPRAPMAQSVPEMPARRDDGLPELAIWLRLDAAARWRALQAATIEAALRPAPPRASAHDPVMLAERLLSGAVAGDMEFLVTAFSEHLALAPDVVAAAFDDPSCETLAILLLAGGVGEIRATSILLHHLGAAADVGQLQDLVALLERTPRRTAERLVAAWRDDETRSRPKTVLRQTDAAERREAAGRARDMGTGEARRPATTTTRRA